MYCKNNHAFYKHELKKEEMRRGFDKKDSVTKITTNNSSKQITKKTSSKLELELVDKEGFSDRSFNKATTSRKNTNNVEFLNYSLNQSQLENDSGKQVRPVSWLKQSMFWK